MSFSNCFKDWSVRVLALTRACRKEGELELFKKDVMDLLFSEDFDVLKNIVMLLKQLFQKFYFAFEELNTLSTGQANHRIQADHHGPNYIMDGVNSFVASDHKKSSRRGHKDAKLTCCSHDGLLYLRDKGLRVLSTPEELFLDTHKRALDEAMVTITRMMESELKAELNRVDFVTGCIVSLTNFEGIEFSLNKKKMMISHDSVLPFPATIYNDIHRPQLKLPEGIVVDPAVFESRREAEQAMERRAEIGRQLDLEKAQASMEARSAAAEAKKTTGAKKRNSEFHQRIAKINSSSPPGDLYSVDSAAASARKGTATSAVPRASSPRPANKNGEDTDGDSSAPIPPGRTSAERALTERSSSGTVNSVFTPLGGSNILDPSAVDELSERMSSLKNGLSKVLFVSGGGTQYRDKKCGQSSLSQGTTSFSQASNSSFSFEDKIEIGRKRSALETFDIDEWNEQELSTSPRAASPQMFSPEWHERDYERKKAAKKRLTSASIREQAPRPVVAPDAAKTTRDKSEATTPAYKKPKSEAASILHDVTYFLESSVDVAHHARGIRDAAERARIEAEAEDPRPVDPVALALWISTERRENQAKLVTRCVRYVHGSMQLQLELEQATMDFALREYYLTQCPSNGVEVMQVKNWIDIMSTVRRHVNQALDDQQDEEMHQLEEEANISFNRFIENLQAANPIDLGERGPPDVMQEFENAQKTEAFMQANARHLESCKESRSNLRKGMGKRLNNALHNLAIKIVVIWYAAAKCMHEVPKKLLSTYMRLCKDTTTGAGDSSFVDRLLHCVKTTKVDKDEMKMLVIALENKTPTSALKHPTAVEIAASAAAGVAASVAAGVAGAAAAGTQQSAAAKASSDNSSSVTSTAGATTNSSQPTGPDMKGQTIMDSYMVDRSQVIQFSGLSGDQSTKSSGNQTSMFLSVEENSSLISPERSRSVPRNLLHLAPVVKSYDQCMQLILNSEGWAKDGKYYLSIDSSCMKRTSILARLKLFRYLIASCIEIRNDCTTARQAGRAFKDDACYKELLCIFALKGKHSDAQRIVGDGYCWYRGVFLLYLRELSGYTLSLDKLIEIDCLCNTITPTEYTEKFQTFLSHLRSVHYREIDYHGLRDIDQAAFLDTVELVHGFSVMNPGGSVGTEEYGRASWIQYLKVNVSSCAVVKQNSSVFATRLYDIDEWEQGDCWSQLQTSSLCAPNKLYMTLNDVEVALIEPNLLVYFPNHFSLLDFEDDMDKKFVTLAATICESLIDSVQLIKGDHVKILENLDEVISSIEGGLVCNAEPFELDAFRSILSQVKPRVFRDEEEETVQLPVIIDLVADDSEDDNGTARTPQDKIINTLQAEIKALKKTIGGYKRLVKSKGK